jgi:arylsulfatase A-like enzyme
LQASDETIAEYAHIADENRRTYAAMVTEMDRAIASITKALEEANIANDTLLMFFSDNGGPPRVGASNRPFQGGKGSTWEGGIRVPALLSWPGTLEAGATFEQRMTIYDVLPTLMAVAELPFDPPKPVDGQNLWPALVDGAEIDSQDVVMSNLSERTGLLQHAYFSGRWKLVQIVTPAGEIQNSLLEILEDPTEQNNLADEYPEVLSRLLEELAAMPKIKGLTVGEKTPDSSSPGSPRSTVPDDRPIVATPYAEAGLVPYPPMNYPAESDRL